MKRFLASTLAVLYFLTQVALTHAAEVNVWMDRRKLAAMPLPTLAISKPTLSATLPNRPEIARLPAAIASYLQSIPLNKAGIQEISIAAPQAPLVILLQDIHLNREAQQNMSQVLLALNDQAHRNSTSFLVGVEGAFGTMDFSRMRAFDDQKTVRAVADYFLDQNKLAAPSLAAISAGKLSFTAIGIDDPDHYQANVQAYLDSRKVKPALVKWREQASLQLAERKAKELNPALFAFDAQRTEFSKTGENMGDYVSMLLKNSDGDVELTLQQFVAAYELEKSLNFSQVEQERTRVIGKLTPRLSKAETEQLIARGLAYKSGQVSFAGYYKLIQTLTEKHGVSLASTPAFDRYIQYVLLADAIRSDKLFQGIKELELRIQNKLCRNDHERQLLTESRQLMLQGKLLEFALTPEEWEEYSSSKFVVRSSFEAFESFYREADIRSEKMVLNLFRGTNLEERKTSVLVSGGFHTMLLKQLLRAKGISYAVVQPKVSKIEGKTGGEYLSIFAREKTPLDRLFEGEKLFLSAKEIADFPNQPSARFFTMMTAAYCKIFGKGTVQAAAQIKVEQQSEESWKVSNLEDGTALIVSRSDSRNSVRVESRRLPVTFWTRATPSRNFGLTGHALSFVLAILVGVGIFFWPDLMGVSQPWSGIALILRVYGLVAGLTWSLCFAWSGGLALTVKLLSLGAETPFEADPEVMKQLSRGWGEGYVVKSNDKLSWNQVASYSEANHTITVAPWLVRKYHSAFINRLRQWLLPLVISHEAQRIAGQSTLAIYLSKPLQLLREFLQSLQYRDYGLTPEFFQFLHSSDTNVRPEIVFNNFAPGIKLKLMISRLPNSFSEDLFQVGVLINERVAGSFSFSSKDGAIWVNTFYPYSNLYDESPVRTKKIPQFLMRWLAMVAQHEKKALEVTTASSPLIRIIRKNLAYQPPEPKLTGNEEEYLPWPKTVMGLPKPSTFPVFIPPSLTHRIAKIVIHLILMPIIELPVVILPKIFTDLHDPQQSWEERKQRTMGQFAVIALSVLTGFIVKHYLNGSLGDTIVQSLIGYHTLTNIGGLLGLWALLSTAQPSEKISKVQSWVQRWNTHIELRGAILHETDGINDDSGFWPQVYDTPRRNGEHHAPEEIRDWLMWLLLDDNWEIRRRVVELNSWEEFGPLSMPYELLKRHLEEPWLSLDQYGVPARSEDGNFSEQIAFQNKRLALLTLLTVRPFLKGEASSESAHKDYLNRLSTFINEEVAADLPNDRTKITEKIKRLIEIVRENPRFPLGVREKLSFTDLYLLEMIRHEYAIVHSKTNLKDSMDWYHLTYVSKFIGRVTHNHFPFAVMECKRIVREDRGDIRVPMADLNPSSTIVYMASRNDLDSIRVLIAILLSRGIMIPHIILVDPWFEETPIDELIDNFQTQMSSFKVVAGYGLPHGDVQLDTPKWQENQLRLKLNLAVSPNSLKIPLTLSSVRGEDFRPGSINPANKNGAEVVLLRQAGQAGSLANAMTDLSGEQGFYNQNISVLAVGGLLVLMQASLPLHILPNSLLGLELVPTRAQVDHNNVVVADPETDLLGSAVLKKVANVPLEQITHVRAIDRVVNHYLSNPTFYSRGRFMNSGHPFSFRMVEESFKNVDRDFQEKILEAISTHPGTPEQQSLAREIVGKLGNHCMFRRPELEYRLDGKIIHYVATTRYEFNGERRLQQIMTAENPRRQWRNELMELHRYRETAMSQLGNKEALYTTIDNLVAYKNSSARLIREAAAERDARRKHMQNRLIRSQPSPVNIFVFHQSYGGIFGTAVLIARSLIAAHPTVRANIYLEEDSMNNESGRFLEDIDERVRITSLSQEQMTVDRSYDRTARAHVGLASEPPAFIPEGTVFALNYFGAQKRDGLMSSYYQGRNNFHLADPHGTLVLDPSLKQMREEADTWSKPQLIQARENWLKRNLDGTSLNEIQRKYSALEVGNLFQAVWTWGYVQSESNFQLELETLRDFFLSEKSRNFPFDPEGKQVVIHLVPGGKVRPNHIIRVMEQLGMTVFNTATGKMFRSDSVSNIPVTVLVYPPINNSQLRPLQSQLSSTLVKNRTGRWIRFPAYVTGGASYMEAVSSLSPLQHDQFDASPQAKLITMLPTIVRQIVLENPEMDWKTARAIAESKLSRYLMAHQAPKSRDIDKYADLENWTEEARRHSAALAHWNLTDDLLAAAVQNAESAAPPVQNLGVGTKVVAADAQSPQRGVSYFDNNPVEVLLDLMTKHDLIGLQQALLALSGPEGKLASQLASVQTVVQELEKVQLALPAELPAIVPSAAQAILPIFSALGLSELFLKHAHLLAPWAHPWAEQEESLEAFAKRFGIPMRLQVLETSAARSGVRTPNDLVFVEKDPLNEKGFVIRTTAIALQRVLNEGERIQERALTHFGVALTDKDARDLAAWRLWGKEILRTLGVDHRRAVEAGIGPEYANEAYDLEQHLHGKTALEILESTPLTMKTTVDAVKVAAGRSHSDARENEQSALRNIMGARPIIAPVLKQVISQPQTKIIVNHLGQAVEFTEGTALLIDGMKSVEALQKFRQNDDPTKVILQHRDYEWQEKTGIYRDAQMGEPKTFTAYYQEHSLIDLVDEASRLSKKGIYAFGWMGSRASFYEKLDKYLVYLKSDPKFKSLLNQTELMRADLSSGRLTMFYVEDSAEWPKLNMKGELEIGATLQNLQEQYQALFGKPNRIVAISDSKTLIDDLLGSTILYNFCTIEIGTTVKALILAAKQA